MILPLPLLGKASTNWTTRGALYTAMLSWHQSMMSCARVVSRNSGRNTTTALTEIIVSAKAQVSAAELALDGVRQEYFVGSRTTLDVLDAETEVVTARIALVSAERDQIVAAYQILGSIGRLTARDLVLPVEYYDADENYLKVRGKWFGTGADTIE
jgi:hypothetical protein